MAYRVSGEYAYVTVGEPGGNGVVHLQSRGSIIGEGVDQAVIDHLVSVGLVEQFDDEAPEEDAQDAPVEGYDEGVTLADLDLGGLRAYAADHGIDLAGATKKADILAAIQAATK